MPKLTALHLAEDERRAVRVPTLLCADLRCEKAPTQKVVVTDMTSFGCRIEAVRKVTIGTFVTIAIPEFVEIFGWVAWSTETALGVDFSHPLPDAVRAHVVALGFVRAA